jgi:hypothetical protein
MCQSCQELHLDIWQRVIFVFNSVIQYLARRNLWNASVYVTDQRQKVWTGFITVARRIGGEIVSRSSKPSGSILIMKVCYSMEFLCYNGNINMPLVRYQVKPCGTWRRSGTLRASGLPLIILSSTYTEHSLPHTFWHRCYMLSVLTTL